MIKTGIPQEIISKYSTFLMDLDGVLWKGPEVIQTSIDFMKNLREQNKRVFFITNSSVYCREDIVKKLQKCGYNGIKEEVIGSSYVAAQYLKKYHPNVKKAFIIGMEGIKKELEEVGITSLGLEPYYQTIEQNVDDYNNFELDNQVGAVVIGIDYNFNYKKLAIAKHYYSENNAVMIATNSDFVYNYKSKIMPGAGTMVKAIGSCTTEPLIVGKPSHYPLEHILSDSVGKGDCIMIGDNLETDIQFGIVNGIDTLLVMTGVTDENMLEDCRKKPEDMPTYAFNNLSLEKL